MYRQVVMRSFMERQKGLFRLPYRFVDMNKALAAS